MFKKLLVISSFLAITVQKLEAQIYMQNFSSPIGWRNTDVDLDGKIWDIGSTTYFSSQGNVASSASFDFTNGVPLHQIITFFLLLLTFPTLQEA